MYETSSASTGADTAVLIAAGVIYVAVFAFYLVAMWRIFTKAHQPGWHAIVPILNTYTLIKIAGRPGWWLLLMFIPCVSFVVLAIVMFDLADSFGRGPWFGAGLAFLSPIFVPILAFGASTYLSGDPYDRRAAVQAAFPRPAAGSWTPPAVTGAAAAPSLPSLTASPPPPPGWYPAPEGTGGQRWWDGTRWTEHRAP